MVAFRIVLRFIFSIVSSSHPRNPRSRGRSTPRRDGNTPDGRARARLRKACAVGSARPKRDRRGGDSLAPALRRAAPAGRRDTGPGVFHEQEIPIMPGHTRRAGSGSHPRSAVRLLGAIGLAAFALLSASALAQGERGETMLVIHGGSEVLPPDEMTPELRREYEADLVRSLRAGHAILARGGAASTRSRRRSGSWRIRRCSTRGMGRSSRRAGATNSTRRSWRASRGRPGLWPA
jgi:hypothetical protein